MRLTKAHLAGLDQYKYSGVDKSIVSRHVLGHWWNWLVTLFPRTLAPNAVSGCAERARGRWRGVWVERTSW
jgi:ethanolaminephosphotransferase